MILIIYCLAVILFCAAFYFTHMLNECKTIIAIGNDSFAMMNNKDLNDDTKEQFIQASAIKMLKSSFMLLIKIVITLGITVLPLLLADITEIADFSETSHYSLRIDVLLITTVVVTLFVFLGRKVFKKQS
ncbi:MAG: hypothetical protein KUG72_08670 [Pseudomonadales bacterium]|nr:hypothetical protein [Pseudomonadales bacterium]